MRYSFAETLDMVYVLQYDDSFTRGNLEINVVDSSTGASNHADIRTGGDNIRCHFRLGADDKRIVLLLDRMLNIRLLRRNIINTQRRSYEISFSVQS